MIRISLPSRPAWWIQILLWMQTRTYGHPLAPIQAWAHSPTLLRKFLGFQQALNRKASPLSPRLRALVMTQVSRIHHCAFCIDFNAYHLLKKHGGSESVIQELEHFENSDHFSASEKAALAYTEAVVKTDREVSDELYERLQDHFRDAAIVDLTALIGLQALSASFNAALDIPSQGLCSFSDAPRPSNQTE